MRPLVVAMALLAGCGAAGPPDSFGVNVLVKSDQVGAIKDQIVALHLIVGGAETFDKSVSGVAQAIATGEARFHYVPGAHAGVLTFQIQALDANGTVVANGTSPPITLVDGHAVSATVVLQAGQGKTPNGQGCAAGDSHRKTCGQHDRHQKYPKQPDFGIKNACSPSPV